MRSFKRILSFLLCACQTLGWVFSPTFVFASEEMEEISSFEDFDEVEEEVKKASFLDQEEKESSAVTTWPDNPTLELPSPKTASQIQGTRPNRHALRQTITALEAQETNTNSSILQDLKTQLNQLAVRPLYRLYNPNSGEHFYTPILNEKETLVSWGWKDEGTDWNEMVNDQSLPVYRLYNPNDGDHHYTMDSKERQALIKLGWINENIAWYADPAQSVPVYRVYNQNALAGAHHYTTRLEEYTALVENGWIAEGIGFYAPFLYSFCEEEINGQKGIVVYNENDEKLLGSQKIGEEWYFFDPDTGFMLQNSFFKAPDAKDYRVYGPEGKALDGKVMVQGELKGFSSKDGYLLRNCNYAFLDGSAYRFDAQGNVLLETFEAGKAKFVPNATGDLSNVSLSGLTLYMQNDIRWALAPISHYTFADIGCLPTTMATIINALSDSKKTPLQIGRQLEARGYFSGDFYSSKPLGTVQDAIPWLASQYNLKLRDLHSKEEMATFFKSGGMIAISMGPGLFGSYSFSHEIVVFGYADGKVNVHDSWDGRKSGVYSLDTVYAQRNLDQYGVATNGPIFGFYNPDTYFEIEF